MKMKFSNSLKIGFSNFTLFLLLSGSLLFISCEQKTEYEKRLQTELSKNTRVDSLFLGYYFGMTTKDFFAHSWDLNSKEIVTGQQKIQYKITELKNSASMDFYPQFRDDKIYKMPLSINYDGWAPWNKHLFADSLMLDMVKLYEEKYDANFIKTTHPEHKKEAFIDIQGNRQISIFKHDDRLVNIEFLDLSATEIEL